MTDLTPITYFEFPDGSPWCAKREDLSTTPGPDYPSGSKVRQYAAMAAKQPGVPMLVGCSADSAMQIYVAAAARQAGVPGIIYTARRKVRSAATEYALSMGAEVNELRAAYLSVARAQAKVRLKLLGDAVRWSPDQAIADAAAQTANIPLISKRVVVPTGSGLTASGVLAGLARGKKPKIKVVAIAVSDMANAAAIVEGADRVVGLLHNKILPDFELIRTTTKYIAWRAEILPDGTPLDPFYAAKALPYLQPGDCLWVPGLRPLAAMPGPCAATIRELQARL